MNAKLLIVDDEAMIRDLLESALAREGFSCLQASSADEGRHMLQQHSIELMILDIMMPGRSGLELLREAKQISPDTSVLMVTALSDMETALSCMHLGAEDYIVKPFSIDRIILTVRNSLDKRRLLLENREYRSSLEVKVRQQTDQIRSAMAELNVAYETTLLALVRALDAREKEIGSHSERVKNYTLLLARQCGVAEAELATMAKGALLHDIGKIGVSDSILLKPAKLDPAEWAEMKRHPLVGHEILSGISFLRGAGEFVLAHHERFDGAGYPHGLQGEEIPFSARIFALVDTLDAMTSDRPYRKALPFSAVLDEVRRCSGSQFDPRIAEVFLSIPRQRWADVAGVSLAAE
jgi:response regulator RpfG family c-di-GMP phosphodiesterase